MKTDKQYIQIDDMRILIDSIQGYGYMEQRVNPQSFEIIKLFTIKTGATQEMAWLVDDTTKSVYEAIIAELDLAFDMLQKFKLKQ